MKTAVLFLIVLATSCAPRAIPIAGVPTAPKRSEAVTPGVEAVRRDSAVAMQSAARLETQVAGLAQSAAGLTKSVSAAVAEVGRLKDQRAANEKEIDGLWKLLAGSEEEARNLFLEAETARKSAAEHKALRLAAELNLEQLARSAASRDAEVESLRLQRDDLAVTVRSQQTSYEALSADYEKATRGAAVGSFLKGWVGICAIALFALAVVWCLIHVYKPRFLTH